MFPIMCTYWVSAIRISIYMYLDRERSKTGKLDKLVHSLLILVNIGARANACLTTLAWLSWAPTTILLVWMLWTEYSRSAHSFVYLCVRSRYRIASARAYRMRGCVLRVIFFFFYYFLYSIHNAHSTLYNILFYWFYFIWTGLTKTHTTFLSKRLFMVTTNNDNNNNNNNWETRALISITSQHSAVSIENLWFDLLSRLILGHLICHSYVREQCISISFLLIIVLCYQSHRIMML